MDLGIAMKKDKIKIQCPKNMDVYEKYAQEELSYFLSRAGIEIVSDDVIHNFISIGRTIELELAGIKADKAALGLSGYIIKSFNGSLYICGGSPIGTLFGVYDFLSKAIGYKRYAEDEIHFDRIDYLSLDGFDYCGKPEFEYPYISTTMFVGKERCHFNRLKLVHPWIEFPMHNSFVLVPPDKYRAEHPEWYAVDEQGKFVHQLNYNCTDEKLLETVFDGLKDVLISSYKPDKYREELTYLMFGIEDYTEWDRRKESLDLLEKYGTDSASLIKFVNRLADKMKDWMAGNQPDRDVKLCIFAYQPTKKPPVLYNPDGSLKRDCNGKAIPVDQSVVLRDNVVVRLAPIEANWFVPFDAEENQWVADLFEGWAAVAKNITAYVYSNNFFSQYANLNNFDAVKADYKFLKKYNCTHVYDQFLTSGHLSPCFTNYRMFLQSNLMWNLELDVDDLTEDFFNNYYKDAKEPMLRYFNELKDNYRRWKELGLNGECNYVFLYFQELWTKECLLRWLGYLDEAYGTIAKYFNQKQSSLYHKLYDRITMESCGLRFLYLTLYGAEDMSEKEIYDYKLNLFEDLLRFDMQPRNAGYNLENLRKEWKI